MYGDIVTKQPLSQLIEKHKTSKADATVFVHKRKKSNCIIEMNDSIKKVAVAGSGTMGRGIAQVSAKAGFDTILFDIDDKKIASLP